MERAINEAIHSIDEEIAELTERRNLLNNINNSNLSNAEKWCLLRETPLRQDKEGILKLIETFIPGADEYIYDVNEVKVRMGLIDAKIPTTREMTINLSYRGHMVKKYPELEEASERELLLKQYINLYNSGASKWKLLMFATQNKSFSSRCFFILFGNKSKLKNIEEIEAQYNRLKDERYQRSYKLLEAYNTFGNEVCRFDALMYDKLKAFADGKFKIQRNGIWY